MTGTTRRVIHTAQALVDEVVEVPALPERGGNSMASSYTRYAGGAANILIAAARSGAAAVHAGSLGEGPNADLIRGALDKEGIAVTSSPIPGVDSGICFVMIEPSAERTFVTTQGAERRVTVESLGSADPQAGDLVCVSGYSLIEPTVGPLLEWLAGLPRGVEVVLDPGAIFASLPEPVRARALAVTTVWSSNADEAQSLTGSNDMADAAQLASAHLPAGAVVVVRDGDRGCAVFSDGAVTTVPGFPQKAVDTNGAGDTHTGALCARVVLGDGWIDACRYANAAAAIKVTRKGPASAPTDAETASFLAAAGRAS